MPTSYEMINSMDEYAFIGGSFSEMTFVIENSDGSPVDLSSATVAWNMSYYGQPDTNILTKVGVVQVVTNEVIVTLDATDTENLSGKFAHQLVITDFNGDVFVPAQGIITIIPKIV